jgi:hypothetical protein
MGLTGLEPVTLRLSSACSNQLSYRPPFAASRRNFEFRLPIFDCPRDALREELLKSTIANRKLKFEMEARGFEPLTSSLQSWRSTN